MTPVNLGKMKGSRLIVGTICCHDYDCNKVLLHKRLLGLVHSPLFWPLRDWSSYKEVTYDAT